MHASSLSTYREPQNRAHQMWNVGIHPFLQSNCGYPSGPLDSSSLDIRYLFTTCLLGLSRRGKLPSQATSSLLICSLGPDPSPSLRKRVLSMKYEILWLCMVYIIQHIQIANSFMCNFDTLFLSRYYHIEIVSSISCRHPLTQFDCCIIFNLPQSPPLCKSSLFLRSFVHVFICFLLIWNRFTKYEVVVDCCVLIRISIIAIHRYQLFVNCTIQFVSMCDRYFPYYILLSILLNHGSPIFMR